MATVLRTRPDLTEIGTLNQPTSGKVKCTAQKQGFIWRLDFELVAARIPVTDAAASGSSGSLKLIDLAEYALAFLGSRQDYTAFSEGSALTGGAGDASFKIALGSAAADAGDAALTGTEVDFGAAVSVTLSGGTGTGTAVTGPSSTALDGTSTAKDIYLNWSGSAATIDANSTIDVWGTVTMLLASLGDD